ncbi:MAG: hypothetical protein H0U04_12450 [Rubrobacter sp.]|nr:hypothetical protein [Rubrobacter sp.]
MKKRRTLRADTTLAPAGEVEREIYVQALPACCLRSFKAAVLANVEERRQLALDCSCGRNWWITSSLDERVLERFVTHGGPRVGSSADHGPSAA